MAILKVGGGKTSPGGEGGHQLALALLVVTNVPSVHCRAARKTIF